MADRLNVTELDFDSIKTNLKNFLKQQTEFQDYDFDGSGLSILLDVLSYNTHYNAYYLNAIANESFLESASLRESVVSHAKRLGYTPRSARAARARVNITVIANDNLPETLVIPKGYEFLSSSFDGVAYKFVTLEAYTAIKSNSQFVFNILMYLGIPFNTVIMNLRDNFGEIYNRVPNIDRIKKYYTPKYTVRDIIRSLK